MSIFVSTNSFLPVLFIGGIACKHALPRLLCLSGRWFLRLTVTILRASSLRASCPDVTRSITSHIACNTKNVIYMVQCNRCNLQYIGEISDVSRTDLTNTDAQSTKLTLNLNPLLFLNTFSLTLTMHSHTDMQLIPLEKIHSSRGSVRKARESHLMDKAMTLEPHGLNRRDELL